MDIPVTTGRPGHTHGGTEAEVKARIGETWVVFFQLKNIWKSKAVSLGKNKIWISNTNVKAVLFYGAETWMITVTTTTRI